MSDGKRKSQGDDKRRKKKFRSDGTPIWGKRHVEGPGIWVSCVKGKEKQTVGEVYELFESVASRLWPKSADKAVTSDDSDDDDDEDTNLSLEDQIANEISAMKRPRTHPEQRFANCQTNTPCVVFISCKPPVNPVDLVVEYIRNIEETGVTRTRYVHRLVPVSGTCVANLPEIQSLCQRVFGDFFGKQPETRFKYKIELRVRNHTTIDRTTLIQHVAKSVPEGHTVDLENPKLFILVEVFKSMCGISIVEDYYRLHKFNVMEIANEAKKPDAAANSRVPVTDKEKAEKENTT